MLAAPTSADHPSRRPVAAGFQKMSEASEQPPPVTAKLRPTAHEPISLSAKPCAPANCGSRSTAADSSNDRVARRSNMTILQKVWSGQSVAVRPGEDGKASTIRLRLECERGRALQCAGNLPLARCSGTNVRPETAHFETIWTSHEAAAGMQLASPVHRSVWRSLMSTQIAS